MREPESYWLRKGPAIPEVADLPPGAFNGNEEAWCSLSPGMRRTVWREAIHGEALTRQLPDELVSRVRAATISGQLATLDEYLEEFLRADAVRPAVPEDTARLQRADDLHQQSAVQISARESI